MQEKRISIFTGHFGSGKTEVAVNYAFKLAREGKKTAIVDLDIVNPFFRAADVKNKLEGKGIKVITPVYANTNVDVPSLPAEINTIFEDKSYSAVLDVGGDDLGARVLSTFNEQIVNDSCIHYFVINTRRPMTQTVDEIVNTVRDIESSSRLKVDMLINNANLLSENKPEIIAEASEIIRRVSSKLSIPLGFVSGMGDVLKEYKDDSDIERLYLEKFIKLPWE